MNINDLKIVITKVSYLNKWIRKYQISKKYINISINKFIAKFKFMNINDLKRVITKVNY